jgi:hypothetical protein
LKARFLPLLSSLQNCSTAIHDKTKGDHTGFLGLNIPKVNGAFNPRTHPIRSFSMVFIAFAHGLTHQNQQI